MTDNATHLFEYTNFLQGERSPDFADVDSACLTPELMKDPESLRKVVPLYFYLTRNKGRRLPVAALKKSFKCGSDLIKRVSKSIEEKKPIEIPGHKHIKPVRNDEHLVRIVDSITRNNGGVSDAELARFVETSRASVNRIRHDLKCDYKPLLHAPFLNERQIQARLLFCRNHQNDDWSQTLFTDESRFATSPDCPIRWWVKKGDKIYASRAKFPFSMMVWGGIVGSTKTPLIKCPKILNAQSYVEMLESNGIVDFVRNGETVIFQQDGARCHTALTTRQWFASKNITLLEGWPANSPDLSSIEQILGIAKRYIIQRFGMKSPIPNDQLENAIFEAFDKIKPETISILTRSVKYRIQLCIARGGLFVGDALGECCRRAKAESESLSSIDIESILVPIELDEESEDSSEEEMTVATLPSFRTAL